MPLLPGRVRLLDYFSVVYVHLYPHRPRIILNLRADIHILWRSNPSLSDITLHGHYVRTSIERQGGQTNAFSPWLFSG